MGHDILFTSYYSAPIFSLIVKDRLLGNNLAAAICGWQARRALFTCAEVTKRLYDRSASIAFGIFILCHDNILIYHDK